MSIASCKRCKHLYNSLTSEELCPACLKELDNQFELVKTYLEENPNATLARISSDTGVSATVITKFIRDGRLKITSDSPIRIRCTKCGAPISNGKLCSKCSNQLTSTIEEISHIPQRLESESKGMRSTSRNNQ